MKTQGSRGPTNLVFERVQFVWDPVRVSSEVDAVTNCRRVCSGNVALAKFLWSLVCFCLLGLLYRREP